MPNVIVMAPPLGSHHAAAAAAAAQAAPEPEAEPEPEAAPVPEPEVEAEAEAVPEPVRCALREYRTRRNRPGADFMRLPRAVLSL